MEINGRKGRMTVYRMFVLAVVVLFAYQWLWLSPRTGGAASETETQEEVSTNEICTQAEVTIPEPEAVPEMIPQPAPVDITGQGIHMGDRMTEFLSQEKEPPVPDYVLEEAGRAVEKIQDRLTRESIVFAFLSDAHCGFYLDPENAAVELAGQLLNTIGDQVDYAFIANGGDMSTGAWDTTRELADEHFETYERLLGLDDQDVPSVWTPGNHDDAPYRATEERVGQKSLSDQIGAKNRASGVVSPEGCCYGYLDLEEYSLRVIVLDTDDKRDWGSRSVGAGEPGPAYLNAHNIGADQLIWLAETALNFSEKESPGAWKIVVVSHVPLNISGWFSDSTSGKGYVHSTANGAEILIAYKNGKAGSLVYNGQRIEYDFSDDPGRAEIICLVHGHEHKFINRNINGLLSIGCPNVMNGRERSSEDGVVYSKTPGTGSGTSFCIFTVDTQERRIYVDAVGAGYDRVFSY